MAAMARRSTIDPTRPPRRAAKLTWRLPMAHVHAMLPCAILVPLALVMTARQAVGQPTPPALALETVVPTGLEAPVFVTHAPDDFGRIFILEQPGRIRIFDLTTQTLLAEPFLDVTELVRYGGEQGLLGLAFHPDYAENGRFFIHYSGEGGGPAGQAFVQEFTVSANPNIANPDPVTTFFTLPDPFGNHNGGWIDFGFDGYLYVAMGDGGGGGDPLEAGQDLAVKFGKILRLDVDAPFPHAPPTNPFVNNPSADPTIWAYGLRNPWRCSFDRAVGDLWIGDVGQGQREEIDFQSLFSPGGENYGWDIMEGTLCFEPPEDCDPTLFELPVHEYSHSIGCSVTGGYVYRGCAIPELDGVYIFSDFCSADIRLLYQPGFVMAPSGLDVGSGLTSFGEDAHGEIYVCFGAGVSRLVLATPPPDENGNGIPDSCEAAPPGDLNGDGEVDGTDLGVLLSGWGDCPFCAKGCAADLDGDCEVDGADLGLLLASWTARPVKP
jgi:glucose/arabinose dehydrogenase